MSPSPEEVVALLADRPGAVWLDGGADGWSIVAWDPDEVVTDARDWPRAGRALTRRAPPGEAPFGGGVLGYLGYEAGSAVEPVPAGRPTPEPPVWLARYRGGLCHRAGRWVVEGDPSFCAEARRLLEAARPLPPPPPLPSTTGRTIGRAAYEQAVERVLRWLEAGDCYQVNLTRPVVVEGADEAFSGYRRLRAVSLAAFGAYLRLAPDLAILSNSPELFLDVDGDRALSRPIKGTRPRGVDARADARLAAELRDAAKDRAELTMIVDLVRNDLGRVARSGTVRAGPREITTHANVHHASQDVEARLKPGLDAWDALAATFPPGSVTGAPKIRACHRIRELEPAPRGVYCGAIGYVSDAGRASWSVAIRTAVHSGATLRWHVGGGVVIDSDPADEWDETVAKGRALAAALGGGP